LLHAVAVSRRHETTCLTSLEPKTAAKTRGEGGCVGRLQVRTAQDGFLVVLMIEKKLKSIYHHFKTWQAL
jgi:hypothetical protein